MNVEKWKIVLKAYKQMLEHIEKNFVSMQLTKFELYKNNMEKGLCYFCNCIFEDEDACRDLKPYVNRITEYICEVPLQCESKEQILYVFRKRINVLDHIIEAKIKSE